MSFEGPSVSQVFTSNGCLQDPRCMAWTCAKSLSTVLPTLVEEGYLVYKCNSMCNGNKTCPNRVLQNGVQVKLEVFKTENKLYLKGDYVDKLSNAQTTRTNTLLLKDK
ncbi:hypothetical protein ACFE04_023353 [Oxalis oulophora]